jgi:hypothetical protein
MPAVAIPPPAPEKTVGIDLGLFDFVTTSDPADKPVSAPKFALRAGVGQYVTTSKTGETTFEYGVVKP